ncbi:MAG: ABC transporter ATP-binding protein [Pseudomonadota bacterium]
MNKNVLDVRDLQVGFMNKEELDIVIHNISFSIQPGETFALLGESGSGKSITALSIMRLLSDTAKVISGEILSSGTNLLHLTEKEMREVRGKKIGMIFQEPMTSLNPVMTIGKQITESILSKHKMNAEDAKEKSLDLLDAVGIRNPRRIINEYPHQLSGGMKQRVMISIALSSNPQLLIADEPTTSLDVTIQAQVLKLLKDLQNKLGMSILFITHDLSVANTVADSVAVMRDGKIIEKNSKNSFFAAPKHPYSKELFLALPDVSKRGEFLGQTSNNTSANISSTYKNIDTNSKLLEVNNLKVYFPINSGFLNHRKSVVKAVDGVSFTLSKGETLAVVGESGCGKTTTGKGILQLENVTSGSVKYDGQELTMATDSRLRTLRSKLQIVFQDPFASLNPRMTIGKIIEEGITAQEPQVESIEKKERTINLIENVGLHASHYLRYPHEFSGGQRQRIAIARALAVNPRLIICDEPTSSLDVSVQAQILNLLKELQDKLGLSYLFITHNLAVVSYIAHKIAVMYEGKIVEYGDAETILAQPQSAYTKKLLAAVPKLDL